MELNFIHKSDKNADRILKSQTNRETNGIHLMKYKFPNEN